MYDISLFAYVLFQCWIYEHFLTICDRSVQHIPVGSPRAKRWKAKQADPCGVLEYRGRLNALTIEDVILTPFVDQSL